MTRSISENDKTKHVFDDYNSKHLEKLCNIVRQGDLCCIVGAGTSIACGYPGWHEFLASLEKPLRNKLTEK